MARSAAVLVSIVLAVSGCSTSAESAEPAAANPAPPPGLLQPPAARGGGSEDLDSRVQMAVSILATRLGVAEQDIRVVTAERVTWPNGSAGCPRPGMSYTQALVDGYRVVLGYGSGEYHYHGRKGADPFYCERPEEPSRGGIQDR